ncbi:5165_t:CDS:2, partial [Racocetra persica]
LLKKAFALKTGEMVDNYLDLIYGEEAEDDENESNESDDNIPAAGTHIDQIKYLPSVDTNGLLIRVRAAIYLSLDELWEVLTDIVLIATFLDPRFKHFNWVTSIERSKAQNLVKTLYNELKIKLAIPDNNEENLVDKNHNNDDDDFFHKLEVSSIQAETEKDNEVKNYIKLKEIRVNDNPLSLSVLVQLAYKYLSIPATSVLSKQLFSNIGNHILAK